jgi:proline iminopeptidase
MRRSIPTACCASCAARRLPDDPAELDWFYGGGAGQFWPDLWARFVEPIPDDERDDLIAAYHRRLFSGDLRDRDAPCPRLGGWENTLASIDE